MRKLMIALLCALFVPLCAQDYNQEELEALKAFFRQGSAEAGKSNGEKLGIADVENWDPAKEANTKVEWSAETPKRVKFLLWNGMGLSGDLDLTKLTEIESVEANNNKFNSITFPKEMKGLSRVFLRQAGLEELILPESAPKLMSVNAMANDITRIALPTDANMLMCMIGDNSLRFSTLPYLELEDDGYQYTPQDTIRIEEYSGTVDLSSENSIRKDEETVRGTIYKWYTVEADGKKAEVDKSEYENKEGVFTFAAKYANRRLICEMTNTLFPLLTQVASVTPAEEVQEYLAEEVEAIRTFLLQPSMKEGKTNADILGISDAENYSPATHQSNRLTWSGTAPKRLINVVLVKTDVAGTLDLSHSEAIERVETNITGISEMIFAENCPELQAIYCPQQHLKRLALPKNAPKFKILNCYTNDLTELVLPEVVSTGFEVRANGNKIAKCTVPESIKEELYLLWLFENELTELKLPSELPSIRYLYLRNNHLTECVLPAELPELQYFWLENNNMRFSTLPEIPSAAKLELYAYNPQESIRVDNPEDNTVDLSSEYTIERNGVVKNTVYKWFEVNDGDKREMTPDEYTAEEGRFVFKQPVGERHLRCEMTNANYPELTLVCEVNGPTTSLGDVVEVSMFEVWPNPATDYIYVRMNGGVAQAELCVYDLAGNAVLRSDVAGESVTVPLDGLMRGCYVVCVRSEKGSDVKKIIVR